MKLKYFMPLAHFCITVILCGSSVAFAQTLGTAASFAVLGGSTVTNTGSSVLTGDLGVSPGGAITGFPPGTLTGTTYAAGAVAAQAQSDLTVAYNYYAGLSYNADLSSQNLGGMTLSSGVYYFSSSAQLTGTLTLNGGGTYVFQMGSTLTTASNASVLLINGASASNVWWQVGSSATLGTGTSMSGNILALASITMNTGANLSGRALARNGAVTLDGNNVNSGFIGGASIPTLSEWGLIILTALLTIIGVIAIRRKTKNQVAIRI